MVLRNNRRCVEYLIKEKIFCVHISYCYRYTSYLMSRFSNALGKKAVILFLFQLSKCLIIALNHLPSLLESSDNWIYTNRFCIFNSEVSLNFMIFLYCFEVSIFCNKNKVFNKLTYRAVPPRALKKGLQSYRRPNLAQGIFKPWIICEKFQVLLTKKIVLIEKNQCIWYRECSICLAEGSAVAVDESSLPTWPK